MRVQPPSLVLRGRSIDLREPLLMGIVDAAPESTANTVERAVELAGSGAGIIDIDGHQRVEQIAATVGGIRRALPDTPISVATNELPTVEAVLAAGASLVHLGSGRCTQEVARLCAGAAAGVVVGADDVIALAALVDEAIQQGVPEDAVVVELDPFVPSGVDRVLALGRPILLSPPPGEGIGATLARIGYLGARPGLIVRVNDVGVVADYVRVAAVLDGRREIARDLQLAPELRREPT